MQQHDGIKLIPDNILMNTTKELVLYIVQRGKGKKHHVGLFQCLTVPYLKMEIVV